MEVDLANSGLRRKQSNTDLIPESTVETGKKCAFQVILDFSISHKSFF